MQNACARGTRTPSTRAARARALFLKNAVLHASTRAHACARAVFENNEFFQRKFIFIFFVVIACLKQYKGELDLELFPQESKKYRGSDGKTRTC